MLTGKNLQIIILDNLWSYLKCQMIEKQQPNFDKRLMFDNLFSEDFPNHKIQITAILTKRVLNLFFPSFTFLICSIASSKQAAKLWMVSLYVVNDKMLGLGKDISFLLSPANISFWQKIDGWILCL